MTSAAVCGGCGRPYREPGALPQITLIDVQTLVTSVGDVTIPSRDLYAMYVQQMAGAGRQPVSQRALGIVLKKCAQRSVPKTIEGVNVRCWIIRQKFLDNVREANLLPEIF